jgi:hypothetical protein
MTDKIKAIVPAAPGFDIVAVMFSDPPEFQYYAIVAWIIEDDEDDGSGALPLSPHRQLSVAMALAGRYWPRQRRTSRRLS